MRDAAEDLAKLKVRVLGISMDAVKAQRSFHGKQKLNFDLLSDPGGDVTRKYGGVMKIFGVPKRVTFVVDPEGVVRKIITKVQVGSHGKDLVETLKELQEK